jgi:hypothetical protein
MSCKAPACCCQQGEACGLPAAAVRWQRKSLENPKDQSSGFTALVGCYTMLQNVCVCVPAVRSTMQLASTDAHDALLLLFAGSIQPPISKM